MLKKPFEGDDMGILVTGAAGFIGEPLAESLAARPFARSLGNLTQSPEVLNAACDGVTKLVHFAYPKDYERPTGEAMAMLQNVIDVCRARNIHLFLPSSWRVFDGLVGTVTDDMMPAPISQYGEAKAEEERVAQESGVKLTILRLSCVYGPRSTRPAVIRHFARALREGEPVRPHKFENGYPTLNLMHVADAVNLIAERVEKGEEGVFHLGPRLPVSTPDIARMIAANLGVDYIQKDDPQPGSTPHICFQPSDGCEAQRSLMAGLGEMAFLVD
jgi:nucleoside-diphosphate-sugar epimerase